MMHPAAQMAWALAAAALLLFVLRRWGWVLAPAAVERASGPRTPGEDGDDEQLPETDRAPRRGPSALACAVAVTAAVRLGLLLAIHR
ncbi:MAG TPA: hypothetical protein VE964_13615 [Myxococcales bacterium]|nr:hypothetical protein [Myxococcales bacterium]